MKLLTRLFERILFSLFMSLILFLASYSLMTGKFPPKIDEMKKSFSLLRGLATGAGSFNAMNQDLAKMQSSGQQPSLEQIEQFQTIALERTRMAAELMKTFNLMKNQPQNPEVQAKIQKINENFKILDKDIEELNVLVGPSRK